MRNITFCVGIKRRKLDEHRSEIFVSDYHYCSGFDRRGWPDRSAALISPRELALPHSFRSSISSIVCELAKVFCNFVNFINFAINVMLLTLILCRAPARRYGVEI